MSIPDRVLVTGATGYIATHIVCQLFSQGYDVVGTVRSNLKGEFLAQRYPGFKYEIVTDLTNTGAFDQVFKKHPDIKYVLHTASPISTGDPDFVKAVINPAVEGTLSALKAAKKYGKNVKRFVYTSSIVAIFPAGRPVKDPSIFLDENTWNPITLQQAATHWVAGYAASKTFSEKAVWEFGKSEKPDFTLATICVPMVYGPPINDVDYDKLSSSLEFFKALLELPKETIDLGEGFAGYIDVRDAARVHIKAFQDSRFDGTRSFPLAHFANDQVMLDILHQFRPKETANIAKGMPGSFKKEEYYKYDVSETLKRLDFEFIPLKKTVLDQFDSYKVLNKSLASPES